MYNMSQCTENGIMGNVVLSLRSHSNQQWGKSAKMTYAPMMLCFTVKVSKEFGCIFGDSFLLYCSLCVSGSIKI